MSDHFAQTFTVPDLGEGLDEVTVTGWSVAVGDQVELNQVLCTVETAKAEVEIPSPYCGRVTELGGAPGAVLSVGAPLVRIATATPAERPEGGDAQADRRAPVLVGYGADDAVDTSRRTCTSANGRPRAKPAARKLAAELGVNLSVVAPGPSGVITTDGVLAAAGDRAAQWRPLTPVQAVMAERMTMSRRMIPDAHASVQVDGANLLALRDRLADSGADVSAFVLILRLLMIALTSHPVLNATWVDTSDGPRIRTHRGVHLGIAVAAPRGLLVPVVFDAQHKTTRQLADCVTRLIEAARDGTLQPADLTGSTFTVSNFGALGVDDGVPVINYPEAAIVGVGSIKPQPVAVGDTVLVRPQVRLTCAFDHRIADGAQVAEFLCGLRDLIEHPDRALLDL